MRVAKMYRIKSNLDVNGRNWGMDFVHGEAFTEREDLARRLKSLGYLVEEVPQTPAKAPEVPTVVPEIPAVETPATPEVPEAPEAPPVAETAEAPETPPETPEAPPAEAGKLTCPICGKVCGSQAVLTRHMNKDHK